MIRSDSYRRRKLDIIREIDFSKKRKCVYPDISKEVDLNIKMLAYELDLLEWKHHRKNRHIY